MDVLIIGGGIIGCAVAEALSHRGADVTVVDSRGIAGGATQASAGMLTPYSEGRDNPSLEALGARSLCLFEPLLNRLDGREQPPFVRTGSLELALSEDEAAELRTRAAALRAVGVTGEFLSAAEVRHAEPQVTSDAVGALLVPAHGYTRAADLARLMWAAASGRGARFRPGHVKRVERDAGALRVVLPDGPLRARHVVLAGGSWVSQIELEDVPAPPVRPVRGQLLQLAWPYAPMQHIIGGPRCYALTWFDGTMLAGATVEDVGFDDRATAGGVRQLLEGLCELVPRAADAAFTRVRVGFRPATPDHRPIIGASVRLPGLVFATGHYRNGVLLAPLTGELVAKAIAGEDDPAFEATRPQRFTDC